MRGDILAAPMADRSLPSLLLALLVSVALTACGDSDDEKSGTTASGDNDRAAVEQAARDYIVANTADDDQPEAASDLSFSKVDGDGGRAEAEATSSATGNKYKLMLTKNGGRWKTVSMFKDVPDQEPSQGATSGDPSSGTGKSVSTDKVEAQIEETVLKRLGIDGQVECPPKIKLRRGNNFECKISGKRTGVVKVIQRDDQGNLNYKAEFKSG